MTSAKFKATAKKGKLTYEVSIVEESENKFLCTITQEKASHLSDMPVHYVIARLKPSHDPVYLVFQAFETLETKTKEILEITWLS